MATTTRRITRRTTTALVLAAGLCAALTAPVATATTDPASDPAIDPDDLPISRITLYRSGVGSFVRQGSVNGDADIDLRFRTDQINDILKSMIVLDLGGGKIEGATYGSKEPLSRRLASFAVDISDNPGRAQLLDRLRGAPVSVRTAEGEHEGTVLGVEYRERVHPESGAIDTEAIVSLVTADGVWSSEVDDILSFRILDQNLAAELNKALVALAEHRADNVKTLDISFRGSGEREVVVGYVQETPVWKTSYRLVLPEKEGDRLTLQGWAIVENTTEDDWEGVELSLVAGQPVSFIMDLYEPVFVDRPEVPVPTGAGARPRTYTGGVAVFDRAASAEQESSGRFRSKAMTPMADTAVAGGFLAERLDTFGDQSASLSDAMRASVAAAASAEDVGEVFQFTLDEPVTVGRQQSAMLPIIAGDIEGRRVSIFSQNDSADHPMRGVKITNDTGLQLMPGPIAVYDAEAYAGDAQIGHVARSDDRLLAYAVDLDVDARTENDGSSTIQKVRIVRGLLEQRLTDRNQVRYFFESNDQFRERTIIVEQPRLGGWDLIDTPKPKEIAGETYRFEVEIGAGEKGGLTVTQERTRSESMTLLDFDMGTLLRYSRDGKASQAVVDAFREAQRLQSLVGDSQRALAALDKERNEIGQDQARVRENMGSIDRNSELYARYMQKLGEQETRLEAIVDAIGKTAAERDSRQQALSTYIAGLNVE
jgi:hypothetical protein